MKKSSLLILVLLAVLTAGAQETNKELIKGKTHALIKDIAVFPGCEDELDWKAKYACNENAMFNHIKSETKYPQVALDKKQQGIIYISFIVDTLGDLHDIKITKGLFWAPTLEAEAMRVIETLPRMIPSKVKGNSFAIRYTQTIRFHLDENLKPNDVDVVIETKKEKRRRLRREKRSRRQGSGK